MSAITWIPINDYPGDQQADLPHGFWAEIGTGDGPTTWSWNIMANDNHGTVEVDGGTVASEADAKAAVESWHPRHAHVTYMPDASDECPWNIGLYAHGLSDDLYVESKGAATHPEAMTAANAWVNYQVT